MDAGNNTAVPPGATTDLDGKARFVDIPPVPHTGNDTPLRACIRNTQHVSHRRLERTATPRQE